jgi:hypothetical protein
MSITETFMRDALAQCTSTINILQTCDVKNIKVDRCKNGNVSCFESSSSTGLACDPILVNDKIAAYLEKMALADEVAKDKIDAEARKLGLTAGASIRDTINSFLSMKCNIDTMTQQSITIPSISLENCNDVNINLYNSMDVASKCAFGWASLFLDGPPGGPGGPQPPARGPAGGDGSKDLPVYAMVLIGIGAIIMVAVLVVLIRVSNK